MAPIEAALLAEAVDGLPFAQALLERAPHLSPIVERELSRGGGQIGLEIVHPARELVARLPVGMCERLLAVPVSEDPETGLVDVAAVEVPDQHLSSEFAFHLGASVRLQRTTLMALRQGLQEIGTRRGVSGVVASFRPTDRPPPLQAAGPASPRRVAESMPPPPRRPTPPMVPRSTLPPAAPDPRSDEPVIGLYRTKVSIPPPPRAPSFVFAEGLEQTILEIGRAESADQISKILCDALEPADVLVMAARGSSFELRAVSHSLIGLPAVALSVPAEKGSVFDIAVRAGFYLGPVSLATVHTALLTVLPREGAAEVYVAPIVAAGRPVLCLLMARFGPSLEATRRADRLLMAASQAIERILHERKHKT